MSDEQERLFDGDLWERINNLPEPMKNAIRETLNEQAIKSKLQELTQENIDLKREIYDVRAENETRHAALTEGLRSVADASSKRMQNSDRYYVRTVIGKTFVPNISGKRMTKLLRIVGILDSYDNPYAIMQNGNNPVAKPKPYCDYPTWLFHVDKITKRINEWLEEHDYYEDFHNTTTKKDRDDFIDMIFEEAMDEDI